METKIFKSYSDFLNRQDKKINGVTKEFADANENWAEEKNNEGCWNCIDCIYCSSCSSCSSCIYCIDCSYCISCIDCSSCSSCRSCSDCIYCSDCSSCSGDQSKLFSEASIPAIENIHQKILEAVSKPNALEMDFWHTCETTHCRAGWVEVLAGTEGKRLAEITSTPFAAMMIYKKSSPNIPVSPVRFYESNELAMADIKRCAEEESKL